MWSEGKTKHMLSRNVNERLQRDKTKCLLYPPSLQTDSVPAVLCGQSIWQLHSRLREDQLLSSESVISHNESERLQQESLGGMDAQDVMNLTASSCTGCSHIF